MGLVTQTLEEVQHVLDHELPKATGTGIKVDTAAPTFPWRDIIGSIDVQTTGPSNPAYKSVNGTAFFDFQFAVGEKAQVNFHIPHDYVAGTDVFFHAHWMTVGTQTDTAKWEFTYAYADGHGGGVFPFASATTVTAEEAADGVAYTHFVTETAAQTITMEPDGILEVIITRITNGGTDLTDDVFLKMADLHYQSTNIGTKDKAPDFYT
jgi:hypothetical protein